MRRPWWFGMMLVAGCAWGSEPVRGCFRSPAEAALMAEGSQMDLLAAQDGEGFAVEGVRRDVLLGRSWAVVRSCGHPERPAVVVEMLRRAGEQTVARTDDSAAMAGGRGRSRARELGGEAAGVVRTAVLAHVEAPVLMAGARVQVVRMEQNVRLTMVAVAERSASVGERIRLRVVRQAGESEEFVEGVVRGAALVEMEGGR